MKVFRLSGWLILLLLYLPETSAQFYNGHQMSFGKNRVQYNDYVWSFYRYENYDVYFNEDGQRIAEYVADFAANMIPKIESFFDYSLESRIIFIVYNRLSDFRESNIGLITGNVDYNIGGVTNISRNKVFLYYEGDLKQFDIQIRAAIARVIINEMLYGKAVLDNMTNTTLVNIPDWYLEGLISYLSNRWDFQIENRVKDGIVSGKYEKFNRLTGIDARYAGHALWKYIADTYGESVIPSIIYLTRINKSVSRGFLYVLGLPLKELSYEWVGYYMNLFSSDATLQKVPQSGKLLKRTKKGVVYQNIKLNPGGNLIAYVTNQMGQYKIWLYDTRTGKKKRILKKEHKLDQITDYSFPVIAWHPSGRILSFITEEKGGLKLYYYILDEKKKIARNFLYFEKVLDYSFSDDGRSIVLSGVIKGQTDIFIHNLTAATNQQLTNDPYNDLSPRFINNSSQIIFTSDRPTDTLVYDNKNSAQRAFTKDLFILDLRANKNVLMRLDHGKYVEKLYPAEVEKNQFIELNDQTGIINRYLSKFDSTISFVDTTVHYRYYAQTRPLSNYGSNIIEQDYNKTTQSVGEIFFNKGRYKLFRNPLELDNEITEKPVLTETRKMISRQMALDDSMRSIKPRVIGLDAITDAGIVLDDDTIALNNSDVDINNYVFEIEKINAYNEKLKNKNAVIKSDTTEQKRPRIRIYERAFYQNILVSQVDFNFLNASYQAFTGGAYYFNPGFNLLFKLGTNDLFEDYKITGGIRMSPDLDANEYLLSFENLKTRLDKSVVFHRQAFKNIGEVGSDYFYIKTHTHELSYIMRYPFNQVQSFVTTVTLRSDRNVYLSVDPTSLNKPNDYKYWGGVKFEYIFDNTRNLGINLYSGMRYKLFAEFYEQVYNDLYELVVFGADIRHYTRIHRSLIWANRFAWSTSQGSSRIIYYLGGVDNWINLNPVKNPTFTPFSEVAIDTKQNYAYQAVATNMRGFPQNIRNGNNFALFNSELRFPVFRYLTNYPISNAFIQNFQIIGFFDIGSAWSGPTPWSSRNAYDNDIIENGPITITIDADRDPFVAGYGFGLRSMLAGYFLRLDWAWGIENGILLSPKFYFSMSLDF